jgi:hypothetical protein
VVGVARKTVKITLLEERYVDRDTKFVRVRFEVPGEFSVEYSNNVRAGLDLKAVFKLFIDDFIKAYKAWLSTPKEYSEEVEV